MKIRTHHVRKIFDQLAKDEVSFTKAAELLNEIAFSYDYKKFNLDAMSAHYTKTTHLEPETYKGDVETAYVCGATELLAIISDNRNQQEDVPCPNCGCPKTKSTYDGGWCDLCDNEFNEKK